jgi:hypothetical protein
MTRRLSAAVAATALVGAALYAQAPPATNARAPPAQPRAQAPEAVAPHRRAPVRAPRQRLRAVRGSARRHGRSAPGACSTAWLADADQQVNRHHRRAHHGGSP